MDGHEHPKGALASPTPGSPRQQRRLHFTEIPNRAGCGRGQDGQKHRNRRIDKQCALACPSSYTTHWALV